MFSWFTIPHIICWISLVCFLIIFIDLTAIISLQIIPPGMEFHHIVPQDGDMDGETETNEDHPTSPDPPIWSEVIVIPFASALLPGRKAANKLSAPIPHIFCRRPFFFSLMLCID